MSVGAARRSVALITGAAGGIGSVVASEVVRRGWSTVASDVPVRAPELATLADVTPAALDVTSAPQWRDVIDWIEAEVGELDLLVVCSGVSQPALIADTSVGALDRHVSVNLLGAGYGLIEAARVMRSRRRGHIVMVGSFAGIAPVPGLSAYAASKFGLRGLALSAAAELGPDGVDVSIVSPDVVDTPMYHDHIDNPAADLLRAAPRVLAPSEVARAVMDAIHTRQVEITVPTGRGLVMKAGSAVPSLGVKGSNRFRRQGGHRRRQQAGRAGGALTTGDAAVETPSP